MLFRLKKTEGLKKQALRFAFIIYIFPTFSAFRLNTERHSPYTVRMRENAGKIRIRIISNTDTFYAVLYVLKFSKRLIADFHRQGPRN